METKKTKLTISGSSKRPLKNFDSSKTQGKKTVVIDKKPLRSLGKGNFNKPIGSRTPSNNFKGGTSLKTNFAPKTSNVAGDFERRKLAEQRATKRLKGDSDKDKKSKLGNKKRELK